MAINVDPGAMGGLKARNQRLSVDAEVQDHTLGQLERRS